MMGAHTTNLAQVEEASPRIDALVAKIEKQEDKIKFMTKALKSCAEKQSAEKSDKADDTEPRFPEQVLGFMGAMAAVDRTGVLPYRGFEDVFSREIEFIFTYSGD